MGGERVDLAPVMSRNGVRGGLAHPFAFVLRPFCGVSWSPLSLYQHHYEGGKAREVAVPGGDFIWCERGLSGLGEVRRKWNALLEEQEKREPQRAVHVERT